MASDQFNNRKAKKKKHGKMKNVLATHPISKPMASNFWAGKIKDVNILMD